MLKCSSEETHPDEEKRRSCQDMKTRLDVGGKPSVTTGSEKQKHSTSFYWIIPQRANFISRDGKINSENKFISGSKWENSQITKVFMDKRLWIQQMLFWSRSGLKVSLKW